MGVVSGCGQDEERGCGGLTDGGAGWVVEGEREGDCNAPSDLGGGGFSLNGSPSSRGKLSLKSSTSTELGSSSGRS